MRSILSFLNANSALPLVWFWDIKIPSIKEWILSLEQWTKFSNVNFSFISFNKRKSWQPSPNLGHTEGCKFCHFLKYLFSSTSQPFKRKKWGGGRAFLVASYSTVSNNTFQKADLVSHKCKKYFKQNEDSS